MSIRPPIWIAAFAAVVVGVSACAGGSGKTAATSSLPGATGPTRSVRPTNPVVTAQPGPRTAVDLKSALLELKDLPPGFAITPAAAGGDDSGAVSSKDPKCAAMVNLTQSRSPSGFEGLRQGLLPWRTERSVLRRVDRLDELCGCR
jgi:hypothetical protein